MAAAGGASCCSPTWTRSTGEGSSPSKPFRITDGRAYGLGIADDKNGIALILHALGVLRDLEFDDYELITVLINGDEEVSSAGSRALITELGAAHDAVFSCEGGGEDDRLALTTAGIGAVALTVSGRASHAGSAPERGPETPSTSWRTRCCRCVT